MEIDVDKVLKWLSVPGIVIAVFAALKALPVDSEIKSLQIATAEIENTIKVNDASLKKLESSQKLTMDIYGKIHDLYQKERRNPAEEEALRVLIQALVEDPMRAKFLDAIALGSTDPEIKKNAKESAEFYHDQPPVVAPSLTPLASQAKGGDSLRYGALNIDLFYCEDTRVRYEPLIAQAMDLKSGNSRGRWRKRLLPNSVNDQAGYGIHSNVIRYNREEKSVAEALAADLKSKFELDVRIMEIASPTPGYISVFLCGR